MQFKICLTHYQDGCSAHHRHINLGAWHSTSPRVALELAQHDLHIVSSETNAGPYDVDFGLSLYLTT
jgi:hypothetical protein